MLIITLFEKCMDLFTFGRTLVISSMMFSDSVESLLWPPIMMMLEPVETAQDLNVIFGLVYFVFTYPLFTHCLFIIA